MPFVDRVRPLIDMREQVVSFPPQPVITEDNLVVSIDTVVYFQVTDARAATYEIANYLGAVEQLTTTTLRNVVGGLNLEEALTSRDNINGQLRIVLDEATGKWGIRVSRVELKAIDPPLSIQDSMEKQMRAERDRRAASSPPRARSRPPILQAEGARQSAILEAEGDAKAPRAARRGRGEGHRDGVRRHPRRRPDGPLLAYQYLQTLPKHRRGRGEQALDHPERAHRGAEGHRRGVLPRHPGRLGACCADRRRPSSVRPPEQAATPAAAPATAPTAS